MASADERAGAFLRSDRSGAIAVLLADDHALVREGTRRLLEAEPDIRVVAEAGDGLSAVEEAQRTHPDVAIIDVAMPGMSGIEATRRIKALLPNVAVLALTAYDDDQYVLALLDAGAAGFMLKEARAEDLLEAVRAVYRGESVLQPRVGHRSHEPTGERDPGRDPESRPAGARLWGRGAVGGPEGHDRRERDSGEAARVLRRAVSRQTPPLVSAPPLSEREMEVLREAARGLPSKDIAHRLDLSVRTVHTHLGNVFAKLKVGSRTEAVLLALRRGWIALDDTEAGNE